MVTQQVESPAVQEGQVGLPGKKSRSTCLSCLPVSPRPNVLWSPACGLLLTLRKTCRSQKARGKYLQCVPLCWAPEMPEDTAFLLVGYVQF